MAQRDGPRYYAAINVANTTGPQAVHITIDARVVKPDGSETDLTHSYWRIIADDNQALTYDGRGNLTDDGIYQYTFDVRGRLTQVATKTTLDTDDVPTHLWAKLVYDYDPQGRRVTKKVYRWNDSLNGGAGGWSATPVTSLRFIWAGWNMLAEVDATTGKPVRSYLQKRCQESFSPLSHPPQSVKSVRFSPASLFS